MKTVEADHFTRYSFPCNLRANAQGGLAFSVVKAKKKKNCYTSRLWLYQGGQLQRLAKSGGICGHWWLGPGQLLLARRPGGKKEKTYARHGLGCTLLQLLHTQNPGRAGGQAYSRPGSGTGGAQEPAWAPSAAMAQTIARLPFVPQDVLALPDGSFLLQAQQSADVQAALKKAKGKRAAALRILQKQAGCLVINQLPFWENGGGFTSGVRSGLYLLKGGKTTLLSPKDIDVESVCLSPDGSSAFFAARQHKGRAAAAHSLFCLHIATARLQQLPFMQPFYCQALLPLSGTALVVAGSNMQAFGLNQNPAFYHLHLGTGAVRSLYSGGQYSAHCSIVADLSMANPGKWALRGGRLHWLATMGEAAQLMCISTKNGKVTQLSKNTGTVTEFALGGHKTFLLAQRGLCGPEVYLLGEDGNEQAITAFNTRLAKKYTLAQPQPMQYKSADGVQIRGFVLLPPKADKAKKYPAIVSIHGGPKMAYGNILLQEMQYLAAKGYAVIFCNPRGSDGRGEDFANINSRLGEIDYEDILGFTAAALARYTGINKQRLGLMGGSYGGFMVNWIIGQTNMFKAAVCQRGISNWGSMQALSDIGSYYVPSYVGASLYDDAQKLWQKSPLKYARQVKTPCLFLHSEQDFRCPLPEAMQMAGALMYFGTPARLCVFKGENHNLSSSGSPRQRLRQLQECSSWFEKYL